MNTFFPLRGLSQSYSQPQSIIKNLIITITLISLNFFNSVIIATKINLQEFDRGISQSYSQF